MYIFYLYNYKLNICRVDENNEPATIQLNHAAQSTFFTSTADEYEKYTKALKVFLDILYEYAITIKSDPGMVYMNSRQRYIVINESVLHFIVCT